MKSRAHFEQACHPSAQHNAPFGRLGDAAKNLQQRAFAGSVAADDADDLALFDFEVDVLERPEFLDLIALDNLSPANYVGSLACEVARFADDRIAQRSMRSRCVAWCPTR